MKTLCKNKLIEALQSKKIALVMLNLMVILFFLPIISGFEWDNVKDYDIGTREVTVINALGFGSDIAKLQLLTPTKYYVIPGSEVLVAEIKITNYNDYNNVFNDMKFYDKNNKLNEINKDFTYKLKSTKQVQQYSKSCSEKVLENGSVQYYNCIDTPAKAVDVVDWKPFDKLALLKSDQITIGIFTEVSEGDYIEWIPTLYGIEIDEWAAFVGATKIEWFDNTNDLNNNGVVRANNWAGQMFQIGGVGIAEDFQLSGVSVYINKSGTADGLSVIVVGVNATNFPNYTNILSTNTTIDVSQITSAIGWYNVSMPSFAVLLNDTNYTLILNATTASPNEFKWWRNNSNSNYTYGRMYHSNDNGVSWAIDGDGTYGAGFQIWGVSLIMDIDLLSPINNYNSTETVIFNCSASSTIGNEIYNLSLYHNYTAWTLNETNDTSALGLEIVNSTFIKSFSGEFSFIWNCLACDNESTCKFSGTNKTVNIDSVTPDVSIIDPVDYVKYENDGNLSYTFNWTVTDKNLNSCWYTYNDSTNQYVTCSDNASTIYLNNTSENITLYVNDSSNNINSSTANWTYYYITTTVDKSSVTSGEDVEFVLWINLTSIPSASANLTYNNTVYESDTVSAYSDYYKFTKTITIINETGDIPYNWTYNITGIAYGTTTNKSLEVIAIKADDCSAYTTPILNFSLRDEEDQTFLDADKYNTSIEIDLDVYPLGSTTSIINFSQNYSEERNPEVCLDNDLSGTSGYRMYIQVLYGGDGYSEEFYYIQNTSLTNLTIPFNINLFDLKDSSTQEFDLTYKDENFLGVDDAILQIQRKYVKSGNYQTIEQPKTDSNGHTKAHLQLEGTIYTIIITKEGEILDTFNNIIPVCQNPTLDTCKISLNSFGAGMSVEDYTVGDDFVFTLDYTQTTRTVESIFSIPSGTSATVVLNVTLFDNIGSTQACSDTLVSSSGTLNCAVPINLGNGTVVAQITKDGTLVGEAFIDLNQTSSDIYGSNIVFLGIFLTITIIGVGISDNPMIMGFFIILGSLLLIALNIVDTGTSSFIGAGATFLWIVTAVIIVLIKGAKRT